MLLSSTSPLQHVRRVVTRLQHHCLLQLRWPHRTLAALWSSDALRWISHMGPRICVGASPEGEKVSRKVVGAGGMAPAVGWTGLRGEREGEEMEQRRDGDEDKRSREDQILRQRDKVENAWACGPVGHVACCEGGLREIEIIRLIVNVFQKKNLPKTSRTKPTQKQ